MAWRFSLLPSTRKENSDEYLKPLAFEVWGGFQANFARPHRKEKTLKQRKEEAEYQRKTARKWAKRMLKNNNSHPRRRDDDLLDAAQIVLEKTQPPKTPTMAGAELRQAEQQKRQAQKWAERMLDSDRTCPTPLNADALAAARIILGKTEYRGHPIMLISEEDYENAPIGTWAFDDKNYNWTKLNTSTWETRRSAFSPSEMSKPIPLTVRRWSDPFIDGTNGIET